MRKAMIFAAGLGTRLRPLTDQKPKALVEVRGKTLLEIAIKKLIHFGFEEIVINVHHFALHIKDFLAEKNHFGIQIHISDESDLLLDTGGGLKKAKEFLSGNEPFILYNVDELTNIDLSALYNFHLKNPPLATLAVLSRYSDRQLFFDSEGELCEWKNHKSGERKIVKNRTNLQAFSFSGIHVVSPKIFEKITEDSVFSILDVYLRLAKEHSIQSYCHNGDLWMDVGKPENITLANSEDEWLKTIY